MSDKEERLQMFMADLRQLLWVHDAELSVERNYKGVYDVALALRVYWNDGDSAELPKVIEGKEPTP